MGEGNVPKEKCTYCRGEGVVKGEEEIAIDIPSGIESGEMIRLRGKGQAVKKGATGDLYVKVHIEHDSKWERRGADLATKLSVKLSDALLGGNYNIESLDGMVEVHIPQGTGTGDTIRVKGKGIPRERGDRGDMLVGIEVAMPKSLSSKAKVAIEELRKEGI